MNTGLRALYSTRSWNRKKGVSEYMKSRSGPDHSIGDPLEDWINGFDATGQRPHRMPGWAERRVFHNGIRVWTSERGRDGHMAIVECTCAHRGFLRWDVRAPGVLWLDLHPC